MAAENYPGELIRNPHNDYLDRGAYGISYVPHRGASPIAAICDTILDINDGGEETAICFAGDVLAAIEQEDG